MARAVLEAIALEAKNNLDIVEGYVRTIDKLLIGGGLTRFPEFNQMQSDIYQKKLLHNQSSAEQTALGAWANAAVALGIYETHSEAIETAKEKEQVEMYSPNPAHAEIYLRKQRQMNALYDSVKKLSRDMY